MSENAKSELTQTNPTTTETAPTPESARPVSYRLPVYRIDEEVDAFQAEIIAPGTHKSQVEATLHEEVLTVTAGHAATADSNWNPLRREIDRRPYRIKFRVNVPVKEDEISASVENGIIHLVIPKAEKAKPRFIAVN